MNAADLYIKNSRCAADSVSGKIENTTPFKIWKLWEHTLPNAFFALIISQVLVFFRFTYCLSSTIVGICL